MDTFSAFDSFNAFLGSPEHTLSDKRRLLRAMAEYLDPADAANVERVLVYLHSLRDAHTRDAHAATSAGGRAAPSDADPTGETGETGDAGRERREASAQRKLDSGVSYAVAIGQTLADALHIDAVTLAAVLVYPAVKSGTVTLEQVRRTLGGAFGEQVARTMASIERFDALQRPGVVLRRSAQAEAAGEELDRERRRSIERRKAQDADALRKMFLAMAEDPRVVIIKIADQLRLLRAMREAADYWRAQHGLPTSTAVAGPEGDQSRPDLAPPWTLDECRLQGEETREIYAPLAGRLGMGRVEGELEDLAFAILEPEEYRWLSEAVEEEAHERASYVERVSTELRREMLAMGINAEVSGRVKHLYSIYKKVKRSGGRDLSNLFDILAFRILVNTVEECYIALGRVHERWRPKDGRIKDFIAAPKPNGYQSLHTTVFCLDGRLAEIQIRTRQMHQFAEYGVATHWYYKDAGDSASAKARPLQAWLQQVQEWQKELQSPGSASAQRAVEAVKGDVLKEQIFLFTPAGDVKELPAGSTPIDFAYRIHSDLGHHVAGARVTTDDGYGKLVKRMVPLDYELKGGDVIEIITRHDAHPTRDWLRFARTKMARSHITKYLKAHERDIDLQIGRERLDRELKILGLRKGLEEVSDDDLIWLAEQLEQPDSESMLVQIGREGLRMATVLPKLRERLKARLPAEPAPGLAPSERLREGETGANVAGMTGMLARPGNCCNPLPGDELLGFITRGRGVVIHRTDCPNLRHLIEREPERQVPVEWPALDGKQVLRAQIIIEGNDRTGLLRDITFVIANSKINMVKVETTTKARPHEATITATLELQRPEQLGEILAELRAVPSVTLAERLVPGRRKGEGADAASGTNGAEAGANGHSATHATHGAARSGKAKHEGKAGHTGKAGRKG